MRSLLTTLIRERVVATVIVINAIALFLFAFEGIPEALRTVLYGVDYLCTLFFIVEIGTKIAFQGWSAFWDSGWNRFDFVVVAVSLPFVLSPVPYVDVPQFSSILLLRMSRLFRLFRTFQFIPNRKDLQQGIARALRASVGVFLALFLYVLTLSLFSHYLFQAYAPAHFGNPLSSLYAMFQIFTVEGWYEIPAVIAADASWQMAMFARAYFAFSVLTGGILGLSLANAVFVDEMVIDNTRPLEAEVKTLRKELDKQKTESREQRQELKALLEDLHDRLDDAPTPDEES